MKELACRGNVEIGFLLQYVVDAIANTNTSKVFLMDEFKIKIKV